MIKIASDLEISLDAATKTFGIIAQRRKGKTYTANVMAEEMVNAGIPWVALDPTGAWWGLRSSVDGKRPGLPVYVFGGDHGDLPLERTAGKIIADLVVDQPGWYILDFSHFESKEAERQLATDFAERFYRRKGQNKTPVHLFVDEADMFAPQRIPSGDQRMLGAFESIVRRGGIRGIGTTLITQRAAVLNKNVLEQIDVLIVLRTVGPNDRKAIAGYVEANGTPEQQAELMGSIASLELGEAWVWEPGEDLFQRVHIRTRRTFNSSATPDSSEPIQAVNLAKVDLEKIRSQMAATIEKAEQDDPATLRRRILELEREITLRPAPETKIIERPVLTDEQMDVLREVSGWLEQIIPELGIRQEIDIRADAPIVAAPEPLSAPLRPERHYEQDSANEPLSKAQRRFLGVLAHFPDGLTRRELGFAAGYGQGGFFNNTLSFLRSHGYIEDSGNGVMATREGLSLGLALNETPMLGEDLRSYWRGKLNKAQTAIFDAAVSAYPNALTLDEVSERTEYRRGGFFNNMVSKLRTMNIIEGSGSVRAVDELFLKEATNATH